MHAGSRDPYTLAYDKLFKVDSAALRNVPKPSTQTLHVPSVFSHAITLMGEVPSDIKIVPPPTLQNVSVGKRTFQVSPTADVAPIERAVTAMAPYFGDAL